MEATPPGAAGVSSLRYRHLRRLRDASDYLDFEIETGQPGNTDRCPVGVGRSAENLVLDGHDGPELVFGVRVKCGHIDDIGEGAAGCFQGCLQIVEGHLNLSAEIRFGASVGVATDLPGNEEKLSGADCG